MELQICTTAVDLNIFSVAEGNENLGKNGKSVVFHRSRRGRWDAKPLASFQIDSILVLPLWWLKLKGSKFGQCHLVALSSLRKILRPSVECQVTQTLSWISSLGVRYLTNERGNRKRTPGEHVLDAEKSRKRLYDRHVMFYRTFSKSLIFMV